MALAATELDAERSDLLAILAKHRQFLRYTTRDLTDEQARARTTVSELTLGGLIKHVTDVERGWAEFIVVGPSALGDASAMTEADWAKRADEFRLLDGETLADVLDAYEAIAAATTELVRTLPDLDATQPCRSPPGSRHRSGGPRGGRCCTSSPRPRSTPGTPTSSASPSTARRRWANPPGSPLCTGAASRSRRRPGPFDMTMSLIFGP